MLTSILCRCSLTPRFPVNDNGTHQAHEDTEKLHHISVCHRVESSNKGVEDSYHGRDHHRHVDVDVYNHAQGGTCRTTRLVQQSPHIQTALRECGAPMGFV